ncbi:SRPBCC domain-containing protein [Paenibacillus filicis]|uniref:SRPBCC domain-containing protein n=1 Tax=Paenibacillus filicis TaxID=669464 RepID=A0ABU9DGQ8_9BACL
MTSPAHEPVPDIHKTVLLNAPIQKVWNAVSTSEGIAAWFMPNNFEPQLGFEFTIQSPYGTQTCRVEELDPPNRLVFTWGDEWILSFNLVERDGQTEFTLTHSGWGEAEAVIAQTGMKHGMVRDRMNQGWEQIVNERLRKHVEE